MPPMRKMHRADPALATRMPGAGGLADAAAGPRDHQLFGEANASS